MAINKDFKSTVPFVKEILPSFLQQQDSKLIEFMEVYYEFLETQGNVQDILYKLDSKSYDNQVSDFYDQFQAEVLPLLPAGEDSISADKSNLLRLAREFYNTKGTPDGIRILFRILFDEEIELSFPSEQVLKPSNANFNQRSILQIRESGLTPEREQEIFSVAGRSVFTASEYFRLDLSSSDTFSLGETITVTDNQGNATFSATVVFFDPISSIVGYSSATGSAPAGSTLVSAETGNTRIVIPFFESDPSLIKAGGSMIIETVTKVDDDLFSVVFSSPSGNISRPDVQFRTFDRPIFSDNVSFFAEPITAGVFVVTPGSGFSSQTQFEIFRSDIVEGAPQNGSASLIDVKTVSLGKTIRTKTSSSVESIVSFSELVAYRSDLKDDDGVPIKAVTDSSGNVKQNAIGTVQVTNVFDGESDETFYLEISSEDYDAHYLDITLISGTFSEGQIVQTSTGTARVIQANSTVVVVNKVSGNFLDDTDLTSSTGSATITSFTLPDSISNSLESTKMFKLILTSDLTLDVELNKSGSAVVSNFSNTAGQILSLSVKKSGSGMVPSDGTKIGVFEQEDGTNLYLTEDQLKTIPPERLSTIKIINAIRFGVSQNSDGSVNVLKQSEVEALSDSDRVSVAEILLDIGTSFTQEGFFSDLRGQPSGNSVIRDGLRFQDFSYSIKSGIPIEQWREIVKSTTHLSGNFLAGEIQATSVIEENADNNSLKLFSSSRPQGVNKISDIGAPEFRLVNIILRNTADKFNLSPDSFPVILIDEFLKFFQNRSVHDTRDYDRRDIFILKPSIPVKLSLNDSFNTLGLFSSSVFDYLDPRDETESKNKRVSKVVEVIAGASFSRTLKFETYPTIDSFNELRIQDILNSDGEIYTIDGTNNINGVFIDGLREDFGRSRITVQTI